MKYPRMVRIRQIFRTDPVKDIPRAVREEIGKRRPAEMISPGSTVAIAAGSRGVANIATVIYTIVEELKRLGATPFIVPAMGSHGGATADGQKKVLEKYGITKERMGVPIKSTMEVVQVGKTPRGSLFSSIVMHLRRILSSL